MKNRTTPWRWAGTAATLVLLSMLWACGESDGGGRDARGVGDVSDARITSGPDGGRDGGSLDGKIDPKTDAEPSEVPGSPDGGVDVELQWDTAETPEAGSELNDGSAVDLGGGDLSAPVDAPVDGDTARMDASIVDGKLDGGTIIRRDTGTPRDVRDGAGPEVARVDGKDGTNALVDAVPADGATDTAVDVGLDLPVGDPTPPTVNGTVYTYTLGDVVFAVDAAKGGRIIEFSLGGINLLTAAKSTEDNNWGSTFWTSPQSAWNWPPPAELDSSPYTASVVGGVLILKSAPSATLGLSVTKMFAIDGAAGAVLIDYAITNEGTVAKTVGPWEISRVAGAGLTFFPMGEGSPRKGSPTLLALQLSGGVAWLDYATVVATSDQKVFADGAEGWLAHVNGDRLFVKAFGNTTTAQAAPGEGEIELFTDAPHTYIELENQGAYAPLAPGATVVWRVRWFLRQLAPTVPVEVGSADLLATVRALVGG